MKGIRILGARITTRVSDIASVQEILTRYGCVIKTRLGLHETSDDGASDGGLVIIEMYGELSEMEHFEAALSSIDGIIIRRMDFPE